MLDASKLAQIAEFHSLSHNKNMLSEATFYGRNDTLVKTEQLLDEMVELGHDGNTTSARFTDLMMEVAENLRKLFGFYSFSINNSLCLLHPQLMVMLTSTAGCTLCHSEIIKYTKVVTGGLSTWVVDFDKHHKGVQFKPGCRYSMRMFISPYMFMDNGEYSLTGGEILSVILHEIGHNFYIGPVKEFGATFLSIATYGDVVSAIISMMTADSILEISGYIDESTPESVKRTLTRFANVVGTFTGTFVAFSNIGLVICNALLGAVILLMNIIHIMTSPLRVVRSFLKYDSEKYSDSFAAAYGYGAELSSALIKITRIQVPLLSSIKPVQEVLDFFFGLYRLQTGILQALLDVHPNTIARLNNTIKYLDAAGENIKDPKVKKEYEEQMRALHALKDEVLSYRGSNLVKVDNRLHAMIQDFTKITDIKELTTTLYPKITKYANLDTTVK
jgi:hypothetical protein